MAYEYSVTYPDGTTGDQPSVNLDPSIAPFTVSVAFIVGAGATASFKMQYTLDNFDDPLMTDAQATWFDSTDFPAATAASKAAALPFTVTRIRAVIATLTDGPLTMTILQGMSIN